MSELTEMGFMVMIKVPDHMTPEEARANLLASIEFGQPEIRLSYVLVPRPGKLADEQAP